MRALPLLRRWQRRWLSTSTSTSASALAAAAATTTPRTIFHQQLHYATLTLQSFFLLHLLWDHFYSLGATTGASMLPTINIHGDLILISKLHSRGRGIAVGDLVSYVHPVDGPGVHVCKRVLGMPGDFVLRDPTVAGGGMLQVPLGCCWMGGDNVGFSRDSRYYGPVPMGLVRGRVVARVWPQPRWFERGLRVVEEGEGEGEGEGGK